MNLQSILSSFAETENEWKTVVKSGLSLRDILAIEYFRQNSNKYSVKSVLAQQCYDFADEMLAVREETFNNLKTNQ